MSIISFMRSILALSASRIRSRLVSISALLGLVLHLGVEGDLVLLGQLEGDLEAAGHGPGDGLGDVGGLDRLERVLIEGDRLVGVGLLEPSALGDLGADLGVELLGGQRLGVGLGDVDAGGLEVDVAGPAGHLLAGELGHQVLDLLHRPLVEPRPVGRDLGEEAIGTLVVALADGVEGRLVEAERPALLGQGDLGEELVGLSIERLGSAGLGLAAIWRAAA